MEEKGSNSCPKYAIFMMYTTTFGHCCCQERRSRHREESQGLACIDTILHAEQAPPQAYQLTKGWVSVRQ